MEQKRERIRRQMRSIDAGFKTREAGEDGPLIEGYFAVFDSEYQLWGGATERVDRHAFDGQLQADVRALTNHDTTLVLGRTAAGTLELSVDDHGLYGKIKVNKDDSDAMNLYSRVQRGDVTQCSFGFDITDEEYEELGGGKCRWTIKGVDLYEVSVCTFPAYEQTAVEARKHDAETIRARQLEAWRRQMKERIEKWH